MNEVAVHNKSFWQLSRKIPLFIALTSVISALLIMTFALIQIDKVVESNIQYNFEVLTQQHSEALDDYFAHIKSDLRIIAAAPMTQKAVLSFSRAWKMFDGIPEQDLQTLYIEKNPFAVGERQKFDISEDDKSIYGQVHKAYHPWFRQFVEEKGYNDLFLFDMDGNLVYSVYKEADFATNLNVGKWRETDLGAAFREGLRLKEGEQAFFDFKPYKASNDKPVSFITQPIVLGSEKKGVLVFQIPANRINAVIGERLGLGQTGEAILVGEDGLARNQSPLTDKSTILTRSVSGKSVKNALDGQKGIDNYSFEGSNKYVGYSPITFLGTKFALLLTQDYDEVFAPIVKIRNTLLVGLVVILAIVVVIGGFVGRSISNPISRLTALVEELASGHVKKVEMQDRGDELGEMARSLNRIYAMSVENTRIRAALDNATTSIMVADADRKVIYMNPSILKLMQSAEKDIQQSIPNFTADGILGGSIDAYHKNPNHQAEILEHLAGIHKTRMTMGGRTFNLTAAPVTDADGTRLGSVVEWEDITESLAQDLKDKAIAEENYRIRVALDNANTNIMVADADRNVIFANKAIHNMMNFAEKEIQKDIPTFNAAAMLNGNIDTYHRTPAHQQNVLATLTSEHPFHLKLGKREFDCVANPIIDKDQNRLGSVIEWKDVTEELAVQAEVDKVVKAVVNGDFSQSVAWEGKTGFMAGLGHSINELKDTVSNVFDEVANSMSALARGDLKYQIEKDFSGKFETLKQDANQTSLRLKQIVSDIIVASNEIASASTEIASGSIDLSQRTENQASSLEETAASMEEMSTTVKQNAKNAQQANILAKDAREIAEEGGLVVEQAVSAMSSIENSSQKVSDIIGVIDEIAFQTNLLALNAAVEAARAGDAGRGFAVVASEVRTLAQRSSEAAKDIKALILDSNSQVREGVQLVGETGTSLNNIVESIKRVADIVSEIAAASQQQASGVGEINAAITQMDEMTQQNAALVEESSASARSLEEQSEMMMRLMAFFDIGQVQWVPRQEVQRSQEPLSEIQRPINTPSLQKPSQKDDADWEEF
jgi:methyl-accepting chemotaxis protein